MLVAAAVCPHPPLLVPELAAGAAEELDPLRSACDAAVLRLLDAAPDLLVVVGEAPAVGPFPPGAWGSFSPYGVDVAVGQPSAGGDFPTLPLSLAIARWLLDGAAATLPETLLFGVSADSDPGRCKDLGTLLADRAPRVAMLAMGDGSARRSLKGPGYLDERAEPYDRAVAAALASADTDALLGLDPGLSAELLVAGRASWQVMAGAAAGGHWHAEVTFEAAPYGVTYLVASWDTAAGG